MNQSKMHQTRIPVQILALSPRMKKTISQPQGAQPEPANSDMQKDTTIDNPDLLNKGNLSVDGVNDPNLKRVSFNLESNTVLQIPDAVQLSDDVKTSGLLDTQIPGDNIANYAFTDLDADNG